MKSANRRLCYLAAAVATLWAATSGAYAAAPSPQGATAGTEEKLAQAAGSPGAAPGIAPTPAAATDPAAGHDPLEARAWRAAAQGVEPLRRYLWRTRMIYNFYIRDFNVLE
jgi:hypothetical protein